MDTELTIEQLSNISLKFSNLRNGNILTLPSIKRGMTKSVRTSQVKSSVLIGCRPVLVDVEVQISKGIPRFSIIGLADTAVREARERVLAALTSIGVDPPDQVLVNLAPAEIRKEGAALDLAIATAILSALGGIDRKTIDLSGFLFLGELGLGGEIKPIEGVIAYALLAREKKLSLVIPKENLLHLKLVSDLEVCSLSRLADVKESLESPARISRSEAYSEEAKPGVEFSDIVGQDGAKRALTIAAAGGHNLLMVGPPGCGKTMLAQAFPSLLPELSVTEALEVASLQSVAGISLDPSTIGSRPFRSPHYSVSDAGFLGGGPSLRPGEATLAHRGVLFMDEFPEFRRSVIEGLRLPLESGVVVLSRAAGKVELPARFQLIGAMNPCPCGNSSREQSEKICRCSFSDLQRYKRKLSQPILDRIDIHTYLAPVSANLLAKVSTKSPDECEHTESPEKITSSTTRELVMRARLRQMRRQGRVNAELNSRGLKKVIQMSSAGQILMEKLAERLSPSARTFSKLLRVALTIADLAEQDEVGSEAIGEAFSYRSSEF